MDRPAGMSSTGAIARQFYNARIGGVNSGVDMSLPGAPGRLSTAASDANSVAASSSSLRDRLRRASMGTTVPGKRGSLGDPSVGFAGMGSEGVIPVKDRAQFRYNFTRFATVSDCLKSPVQTPDLVGISARATAALRAAYSKNRPDLPPDLARPEPVDGKPLLARALESAHVSSHMDFESKAGFDEGGARGRSRRKTLVEIIRDREERKLLLQDKARWAAAGDVHVTTLMRNAEEERAKEEREEMVAHYRALMAKRREMGGPKTSIAAVAQRYETAERLATQRLRQSAEIREAYYARTGKKYITVRERRIEELEAIEAERQAAIRDTTARAARHDGPGYQKGTFSTVRRTGLTHSPLVAERQQRTARLRANIGGGSDSDDSDGDDRFGSKMLESARQRSIIRRPIARPEPAAIEDAPDNGDALMDQSVESPESASNNSAVHEEQSPPREISEAEREAATELKLELTDAVVNRMRSNQKRREAKSAAQDLLAELDAIASDEDSSAASPSAQAGADSDHEQEQAHDQDHEQAQEQAQEPASQPDGAEFDAEWEDVEPSSAERQQDDDQRGQDAGEQEQAFTDAAKPGDEGGDDWNPFDGSDEGQEQREQQQEQAPAIPSPAELNSSDEEEEQEEAAVDEAKSDQPEQQGDQAGESEEDRAKREAIIAKLDAMKPIVIRKELRALGLSTKGTREDQYQDLKKHLLQQEGLSADEPAATAAGQEPTRLGSVVFMRSGASPSATDKANILDDGVSVVDAHGRQSSIQDWIGGRMKS
eukprot:INCI2702.1.p1 GENE.INCI2702.1~~INCI2702.1.p1  ORF type:complete len:844 (+),score=174.45 INCI2702.1:222-2534(+)